MLFQSAEKHLLGVHQVGPWAADLMLREHYELGARGIEYNPKLRAEVWPR